MTKSANTKTTGNHRSAPASPRPAPPARNTKGALKIGVIGCAGRMGQMLVRAAESSYRSGRMDDALAAYDRAAAMAQDQGNQDRAFALGSAAAAIEHQRDRHAQARDRYRRLALSMTQQPKAPDAHLLAIHHAGQIALEAGAGTDAALDQYMSLLEEHLQTWPDGPTADETRWGLGSARQYQGDREGAISVYRAISQSFANYDRVVEAVGACCLAELQASRDPRIIHGKCFDKGKKGEVQIFHIQVHDQSRTEQIRTKLIEHLGGAGLLKLRDKDAER